jgi:hypothetical protein
MMWPEELGKAGSSAEHYRKLIQHCREMLASTRPDERIIGV